MTIFINPGSGPVADATVGHAIANIAAFVDDLQDAGREAQTGGPGVEDRGRWTFIVTVDERDYEVEMPGLPLDEVRYVDPATQNIWDFPRLYVDGSSWVWKYALGACESDEDEL